MFGSITIVLFGFFWIIWPYFFKGITSRYYSSALDIAFMPMLNTQLWSDEISDWEWKPKEIEVNLNMQQFQTLFNRVQGILKMPQFFAFDRKYLVK